MESANAGGMRPEARCVALCRCVVETGAGPRPALGMLLHHALSSAAGLKYLEICEDRSNEVS